MAHIPLTAAVITMLLTGCGGTTTTAGTAGPTTTQPGTTVTVVTTAPPVVSSSTSAATTTVTTWPPSSGEDAVMVYLTRGETLAATWRPASPDEDEAVVVMDGLLSGPTALEKEAGFGTTVPDGTTLLSVAVSGETAVVDLSAGFGSGGGSLSMFLRVAQVVYSLTELPGVTRVEFMLDGSAVQALGGEGIIVEGGVTRADFADLLPPVLLIAPAPLETIRNTVAVRGNVTEDVEALTILLTGRDGEILAEATPELQAPLDGRKAFEAEMAFSGTAARGAVILTWTGSDGSEETLETPVEVGG